MEFAMLNNGIKMPMEGFGVFQVRDKEECKRSVLDAIKAGPSSSKKQTSRMPYYTITIPPRSPTHTRPVPKERNVRNN